MLHSFLFRWVSSSLLTSLFSLTSVFPWCPVGLQECLVEKYFCRCPAGQKCKPRCGDDRRQVQQSNLLFLKMYLWAFKELNCQVIRRSEASFTVLNVLKKNKCIVVTETILSVALLCFRYGKYASQLEKMFNFVSLNLIARG